MSIKRYSVNYKGIAECQFDIDHSVLTEDKIYSMSLHSVNRFWVNHKEREGDNGCTLSGVLKILTRELLEIQFKRNLNIEDLQLELSSYPPLNGTCGITLIKVDPFILDEGYMSIIIEVIN